MKRCLICGKTRKNIRFRELLFGDEPLCHRCALPIKIKRFRFCGCSMLTLYQYDAIQNTLLTYKRGDRALAPIFLAPFRAYLIFRYARYILVPVPSHSKHDEERGFNPVMEAFSTLGLKMVQPLYKRTAQRQGGQMGKKRSQIAQVIAVKPHFQLSPYRKYLLVDDIYTTGSTLRTCLQLLKQAGAKHITILVIANHSRKFSKKDYTFYQSPL